MLGRLKVGHWWMILLIALKLSSVTFSRPHRVLLDTDVDTDDVFALLYLLKLNRSQFDLKALTINANGWTHAGHAVHHIYDLLYMMDRDDVLVGVGGEGGISQNGIIFSDVGGYLPIIEQGMTTTGYCRYRQAIPVGQWGLLDIDTNFGIRKAFLPQGRRKYSPLQQPTTQQVMLDVISKGPTTVFLIGAQTNFALFLMSYPHLRKNIQHIYIMGGSVRSNDTVSCKDRHCGVLGNLFTASDSNPYAEFNIFADPFAAYQVIHSGIPVTLVPLDATNTIPITKEFMEAFERRQDTYEAQYCFKTLKLIHDIRPDQFFKNYYLWDSFMTGIAASIMSKPDNPRGDNEFAEMEYMNITVHTSNEPYGLRDGSNPFFDGRIIPKFYLKKNGVHSGHVQRSIGDPFCLVKNEVGKCKDGYTEEMSGLDGVRVLVATKAKPNKNVNSTTHITKEFSEILIDVLNRPQQSGRFNFTTQFPDYKNVLLRPDFGQKKLGKPIIFDMDMSPGDFLALLYLLKVPVEVLNLKAIFVTPTGWASAATIDVVYDLLHMMGRDDIPIGLGDVYATNQSDTVNPIVGDCKYVKAIPHGGGGFIDSDTLYGLARELPRSPRRYTANPELPQPLVLDIWKNITTLKTPNTKITILSNGPLTTLGKILSSDQNATSKIQDVIVVGGHITDGKKCDDEGNVFTIPSNKFAEFNMFLDPVAAKLVINSKLDITMIPLRVQRTISSFEAFLQRLAMKNETLELQFAQRLIAKLDMLQKQNYGYRRMGTFLGEILGSVLVSDVRSSLEATSKVKPIRVVARGIEAEDGQTLVDEEYGRPIKILENVNDQAYYDLFASQLGDKNQSAMVQIYSEEARIWSALDN